MSGVPPSNEPSQSHEGNQNNSRRVGFVLVGICFFVAVIASLVVFLLRPTSEELTEEPKLFPSTTPSLELTEEPTLSQREVLVILYESTNGERWGLSTDWLTTSNECSWYGVTCSDGSNVSSLDLSKSNLIPSL